jgi:hypothetical protein
MPATPAEAERPLRSRDDGAGLWRPEAVPRLLGAGRIPRALLRRLRRLASRWGLLKNEHSRHQWSIGIYAGRSPVKLAPAREVRNPVLAPADIIDIPVDTVADPFMLRIKGTWYMFFEIRSPQTEKGEIALAVSPDALAWTYQGIVLSEPFHLSYPYVFDYEGEVYMIPETYMARSVRLYRAVSFPTQWSFIATLLNGPYFVDTSIVRRDGRWWIFTETSREMRHDTLRLYYADDLTGPWREHPQSPIIEGNAHIARPAGRVLKMGDRLIRYAQDDHRMYGRAVRALEILQLTTEQYRERPVSRRPILGPSGTGWNGLGMHHLDPHLMDDGRWIACVDGVGVWRKKAARP